jgi:hypothetical protein
MKRKAEDILGDLSDDEVENLSRSIRKRKRRNKRKKTKSSIATLN